MSQRVTIGTHVHSGAAIVACLIALAAVPGCEAANIIVFGDNANSCGGAVICSTNGTTGYLNDGSGTAFDLSTLPDWFQIDTDGRNHLSTQTSPEPNGGAGSFLVVNDTGSAITSYSITLTDTFTSTTASVKCSGAVCTDNFTAQGSNGWDTELSGPDWVDCTQGTTVGMTCQGQPGGVAADFSNAPPQTVVYSWSGGSIAPGAMFDIRFASWNNTTFTTPTTTPPVPEPATPVLSAAALMVLFCIRGRLKRRRVSVVIR